MESSGVLTKAILVFLDFLKKAEGFVFLDLIPREILALHGDVNI